MENHKYEIGDKVIFNSQIFIVHDVQCTTKRIWYFIKGYNKENNTRKIITEKFLKPYNIIL